MNKTFLAITILASLSVSAHADNFVDEDRFNSAMNDLNNKVNSNKYSISDNGMNIDDVMSQIDQSRVRNSNYYMPDTNTDYDAECAIWLCLPTKFKASGLKYKVTSFDGKKGTAERILYEAFEIVKEKTNQEPMEVYLKALENVKPLLEIKSRRVGGSNVQVPIEVNDERAQALALRWLVNYAKSRNGKGMAINLANEIMDAANGVGGAVKKREDTHKMAEANKAFAHYRW